MSQDIREGPSGVGGEARRTQEVEIDVLVAHELATGSPAAMHVWEAAGIASWNDSAPGFQAYHKLGLGCVDFRVPGYRIDQLRWLLEAAPVDQRLPPGWHPSALQSPKAHPALRFVVPKVEVLDFNSVKYVVEQAVNAIADLRRWWDAGGDRLLQGSSDAAVQWLVSHATRLARLRGWIHEAEELAAVARSLSG